MREFAVKSNSSHPKVLDHFKQFGKPKHLDKRVPHELRENRKVRCYEVCSALVLCDNTDPFFDHIGTCDIKWIVYNNRRHSAQWPRQVSTNTSQSRRWSKERIC
ncbi:Histone-lysine N-methyltransferase SETMAR [Araneus ventricosus]|uniref:Histone-lysine N-methyltransferase SETMAR n=1 Tax=Araneus ventricosus TaxID=182803 RepID=A0A4Y2G786_ARAVE|nr:Histone-lysine N-methyltransferase SETMAR [Araneus ventricosus]